MEKNNLTILVSGFVMLIIGIGLVSVIANETNIATSLVDIDTTIDLATGSIDLTYSTNESYNNTVANAPTGWQADGTCPITNFVLYNASTTTDSNNIAVDDTDYWLDEDIGVWHILETSPNDVFNNSVGYADTTNVSAYTYSYCPDEYLTQGWTRSTLNLVVGFFAIALMLMAIAMFYTVLKNEGLIDI